MPLQMIRQDITKMSCDAIVDPSNEQLAPGGGIDEQIHKAAGERLLLACRKIGGISISEAVITPSFDLPCKYVIHTAGPLWLGGEFGEEELLKSTYENVLALAKKNSLSSIAVPLISSGTYGFPKDKVLKIAIDVISAFLFKNEMQIFLVVYDKESYELSEKLFLNISSFIDDNYESVRKNRNLFEAKRKLSSAPMPMPLAMAEKSYDIEDYIKLDESFAMKLFKLIDAKGMDDIVCYKKANVSKQTWYKIVNDKNYKPNKKTVISFALALELTLGETQDLLESVGFILSNSSLFDVHNCLLICFLV